MTREEAIELVLNAFEDQTSGPSGPEVLRALGIRTPFDDAVAQAAAEFRQELDEARVDELAKAKKGRRR